jgi:two-component system, OmpR family, response regulator VicR
MKKILFIEDEESLNRGISLKLEKEGYTVYSCSGIKEGRTIFLNEDINLIICDITLNNGNGLEFCREIRITSNVRFIFLTALDQEMDVVMGYEAGADDYITKPFSLAILLSKVNAMFKRMEGYSQEKIESGKVVYLKNLMKAIVDGEEKELTKTELKLLLLFMEHPKQIISKRQILENIFDLNGDFIDENTVAVNIRRLREKIENDASRPEYIKNVRGLGYLWDKECHVN